MGRSRQGLKIRLKSFLRQSISTPTIPVPGYHKDLSRGAAARALPPWRSFPSMAGMLRQVWRPLALLREQRRALVHRAAVVEDILMAHPAIANVRAFSVGGEDAKVHAVVLPQRGALRMDGDGGPIEDGSNLIHFMHELIRDGSLQRVGIVHTPEKLPSASLHDRIGLRDLLMSVHAQVDEDDDGTVTRAEMKHFLEVHRLEQLTPLLEKTAPERFSFAEFKNFLLDTHVVSLECGRTRAGCETEVFGAHASLVSLLGQSFFLSADTNSDGVVTLEELEAFFTRHGIGDAERARRAFVYYDDSDDGEIDQHEFLSLLLGEGVLRYDTTNTFLWGDYQHLGDR